MINSINSKAVAFSEKVFERLLAAYPRAHREEYGVAMTQLFRDQCRDAWSESRGWGLARLWLRVLPDVVGTSLLEHLEPIKERKFMLNRIAALFRSVQSFKFLTMFTAVFLLVVITATLITFILPESFVGESKVYLRFVPESATGSSKNTANAIITTEAQLILSDSVLNNVINNMDLTTEWGKKYTGGDQLKTSEALVLLRRMIDVQSYPRNPVIHINVYSDKADEAAQLANAIVKAYFEEAFRASSSSNPNVVRNDYRKLIQRAVPNFRPARPNKPRNIAIGVLLGIVLGLIAGGGVAGISFLSRRNAPPKIAS